jgi:hypothetical protein
MTSTPTTTAISSGMLPSSSGGGIGGGVGGGNAIDPAVDPSSYSAVIEDDSVPVLPSVSLRVA